MTSYAVSSLIASFMFYGLGVFVFLHNPKKYINRIYAIQSFVIGGWVIGCFCESIIKNYEIIIYLDKVLNVFAVFSPAVFLHTHCAIIHEKADRLIKSMYGLAIILLICSFFPIYIKGVEYRYGVRFISNPGPVYWCFVLYATVAVLSGLYIVWCKRQKTEGYLRLKLTYVLIASTFMFFALITYLAMVLNIAITPLDNTFNALYGIIMTYAIVKHKLLEIDIVIKKTLVFAGLFAGVYAIIAGFLLLSQLLFERIAGGNRWVDLIPSIAVIVMILRPLESFLVRITDRFLFQKKYDYRQLLKTFSKEVLTVLDIDKLVNTTVERISQIMRIKSCSVLLYDKEKGVYKVAGSVGLCKAASEVVIDYESALVSYLERTQTYLWIGEQGKDAEISEGMVKDMNMMRMKVVIPLIIHADTIGILMLGKKKSDREYTVEDIDILGTLARTLSIAISNAKVMDELGKTQAEAAQKEKMAVIGTLAAGINHEICNPLGIIRGHCEAFLLNLGDGLYNEEEKIKLLEKAIGVMVTVIKETDRATGITKRLSSFAKPTKGYISDDVDVREAVEEVLRLLGYEMKLDGIDVRNDVPEGLKKIRADKKQIEEVMFNLIRNAAQAIEGKGKIEIRGREESGKVVIEIEDTGKGIPANKLGDIFKPFYTTKESGVGTGLGLFIVRQIVERNDGRIDVKSTEGKGTTFILSFRK